MGEFMVNIINLFDEDINNYVEARDNMTIKSLKSQIISYTKGANYCLIHCGEVLEDDQSCEYYNIGEFCCLITIPNDVIDPLTQDLQRVNIAFNQTIRPSRFKKNHGNCLAYAKSLVNILADDEIKELELSTASIIEALNETNCDLTLAKEYLSHTCPICLCPAAMSELTPLGNCDCQLCNDCFASWIEVCVREKEPIQWTCPVDKDHWDTSDCYLMETIFPHLLMLLKHNEETKQFEQKFNEKVNIFRIMLDENFLWCSNPHCENGFLASPFGLKMICTNPRCGFSTCKKCNKTWTSGHENRTCEEFAALNLQNESDITQILRDFGIQCPKCKKVYLIARGGCMHFTCQICRHEFCAGCKSKIFKKSADCPTCIQLQCPDKGLHSHCPRNCFSYLRDMSLKSLEKLLKTKDISYLPESLQNYSECQTMITNEGMHDFPCLKRVIKFDLCEFHAKEYLTGIINRNQLDPVDVIEDVQELRRILERGNVGMFARESDDSNLQYRKKLISHIKKELPLPKLS